MGKALLGILIGSGVFLVTLGFTPYLGIAILVLTVGQPNEPELDVLLSLALLAAISAAGWIGRRVTHRLSARA